MMPVSSTLILLFAFLGQAAPVDDFGQSHPLLAAHTSRIEARFGDVGGSLTSTELTLRSSSLILLSHTATRRPILVVNMAGKTQMIEHPVPMSEGYVYQAKLVELDQEHALVVWHGTSPRGVHGRIFDATGTPVWTGKLVSEQSHPKLHVVHRPGLGALVAVSTHNHLVVQGVGVDGSLALHEGLVLVDQAPKSAVGLAADADGRTAVVYSVGKGMQARYAVQWLTTAVAREGEAIILGEVGTKMEGIMDPFSVAVLEDGTLRADLPLGMAGDAIWDLSRRTVDVRRDGTVTASTAVRVERRQD